MHVRLVEFTDSDQIVKLGRLYADEVADLLPHIDYSEEKTRQTVINSVLEANPTIFVAEHKGRVIGMMVASIHDFYFMSGHFVQADIFYVHPDYRGTRAAALLIVELRNWVDLIDAKITLGGNANKLMTDRTARLYERFGFQQAGLTLLRPKGA